jgi:nicotinate-nucleotide--dimethylbenzimidazole phosphoribosyltransferase
VALEALELEPLMDFDLRLGEGTGAALAMHLIEAATRIYHEMATFGEAGVSEKSA